MVLLSILACNTAPLDYREVGSAPGYPGQWMYPTPWCEDLREVGEDDIVVDGLRVCIADSLIRPVDDPVFSTCEELLYTGRRDEEVVWLYDGEVARAYTLAALEGREGVHDELHGIPIFVDF